MLWLLNQTRTRQGLGQLTLDPQASVVARQHGQDMCARRYFSHTTPEGRQPWDRLKAGGVRFRAAGENIAMGHPTPTDVHRGWMESQGHRENILRPVFTRVGLGLYVCRDGTPYWTQLFMS